METRIEVVKPTLLVSFFSLINYGIAFLTQIIVANYYGNSLERDTYLIALTIPSYIISVFVASLPSVYLPVLIEAQNESVEKFWQFARNVFFIFFAGLLLVVGVCWAFSTHILLLVAPEISKKTLELTSTLFMILLPSIVLNVLSGLLGSLYYSRYKFLTPSLATVLNSLLALVGVLILHRFIGIYSLAVGFSMGSLAGFLFLLPIAKDFPWDFNLGAGSPYLRSFLSRSAPLVFAGIIYQATTIAQRRYASLLPVGSVSSLGYSMQITTVLASLLSGGIATILFPLMSNSWVQKDMPALKKYFSTGVIVILVLTIPFVVFFYFLGFQFVRIIFERGSFNLQDSVVVSNTLFILSGTLVFSGLGNIVAKGFYFSGHTSWVAVQEILILAVYVYLGYLLSVTWSLAGLALATTITSGLSMLSSFFFMNYLVEGLNIGRILIVLTQIIAAAIVSGSVSFGVYVAGNSYMNDLVVLAFVVILQTAIYYLLVIFWFKIPELLFVQRKIIGFIQGVLGVF